MKRIGSGTTGDMHDSCSVASSIGIDPVLHVPCATRSRSD